jgi:hypothetical protein
LLWYADGTPLTMPIKLVCDDVNWFDAAASRPPAFADWALAHVHTRSLHDMLQKAFFTAFEGKQMNDRIALAELVRRAPTMHTDELHERASNSEAAALLIRGLRRPLAVPSAGRVTGSVSAAGRDTGSGWPVGASWARSRPTRRTPVPSGASLALNFLIVAIMCELAFKEGSSVVIVSRRIAELLGG